MNKRQFKKQVTNFINGRPVRGIRFYEEVRYPRTDGSIIITELLPVSPRFYGEVIRRLNYPCHWDSPFIISMVGLNCDE